MTAVSAAATLLLFDIDGTLVWRASTEHATALREALHAVHGLDPAFEHTLSAAGRTDGEIARLLLLAAGVPAEAIDDGVAAVQEHAAAAYARLCPPDLSDRVLPGIPELLGSLGERDDVRLSLVTGNFEPIARLKLARAGVGSFFESGQGGFGSDSEDRTVLPALARRRAGADGRSWPRDRTIVIGDTPRDIACARADGVRVIGVATGPHPGEELREADAVAQPGELAAVLRDMLSG
ncbi:MAG TPA: haloacid dehalogenase-like hydrolase [Solirubrobacteraceae bacterium]|nr:haloacid dehalogenase-like hydrolase [Solirubrobacteraceae bacterium]